VATVAKSRTGLAQEEKRGEEGREGEQASGELGQQAEIEEGREEKKKFFFFLFSRVFKTFSN
jgi:hypothetical protein